ncbi:MAG: AEC family transporter [bacterium]|nr:AEC family transporter [Candidatus Sumerlaeota bacterium]
MMQTVSFSAASSAIAAIFLLGLIGFLSVKRRILSETGVSELARVLVDLVVPGALFHAMYTQYASDKLEFLWKAGVAQVMLFGTAAVLSTLLHRVLHVRSHRGTIITLSSLQNNVYVPLPVCFAVLPPEQSARAAFFVGCFVIFFNPLLWTVGVILLSGKTRPMGGFLPMLSKALNPPVVGCLAGLILKNLFMNIGVQMPDLVLEVARLCKEAMAPLAMIVLGGLLAGAHWSRDFEVKAISIVTVVKLFILPLCALAVLGKLPGIDPVFAFVVMTEAACPPATNISIAASRYGGNTSLIAIAMLVTYLVSIVTIPAWLAMR